MKTSKTIILFLMLTSPIAVFSQQRCSNCGGIGMIRCSSCGGNGYVVGTVWNPYYGVYQQVSQPCANCRGYGGFTCNICNGKGAVPSPTFKSTREPIKTNQTVQIKSSTGADKGYYAVYIGANGAKFVYFAGDYRKLNSNNSFSCNGNTYYAR